MFYEYDINKMQNRIHIIDGLLIALADIDAVIELIKKANSKDDAKNKLCTKYNIDDEQASAILKMPLSRLIKLEAVELEDEKSDLLKEIDGVNRLKNLSVKEISDI